MTMDRDKVIKAIECRKEARKRCGNPCEETGACVYARCVTDGNRTFLPYYCDVEQICEDVLALLNEQPVLVHCSECIHCGKSTAPGFWYCEAWDEDVSMDMWNPDEYYCAEGEKREL